MEVEDGGGGWRWREEVEGGGGGRRWRAMTPFILWDVCLRRDLATNWWYTSYCTQHDLTLKLVSLLHLPFCQKPIYQALRPLPQEL